MAGGLRADWTSFVNELSNPGGADARYESHKAVTAEFVKGLHTALIALADLKLDPVLGKSLGEAMPRRAESWRSGRSPRNIARNLDALRAMYEGENGPGLKALLPAADTALADLLSGAFEQTLATARAIDGPLARAVADPAKRPAVERLAREVRALKQLVSGRLAPALGTPLGFNALDGD
jgi:predicted lipoprotein